MAWHGALYDALAAGGIEEEKLAALLTGTLPQLIDGGQASAWIGAHDKIDHGLLEQALAGVPAGAAAQVREACARWGRLRFAIDATPYPRPDADRSPGRDHVPSRRLPVRRHPQDHPGLGIPVRGRGRDGGAGAPLVILDAGYSAAGLTAALRGCPVHLLIRLSAGSVFYADPVTWPGKKGRPGKHGMPVTCAGDPAQASPEPDESLTLPGTPRYGTVRVSAWHQATP